MQAATPAQITDPEASAEKDQTQMGEEKTKLNKTCSEQPQNQTSIAIVPTFLQQQSAQREGDHQSTKQMAIWGLPIQPLAPRESMMHHRSRHQERSTPCSTVRRRITQRGFDNWMKGSSSRGYCLMEEKARMADLVGVDYRLAGKGNGLVG